MSVFISEAYQSSVSSSPVEDHFVLDQPNPPDNANFAFTVWSAGGQAVTGTTNKIELYWDASGTGSNMQLVDAIYTQGETYQHQLDATTFYTVDGTARFVVRRSVLGTLQTAREIYAQVQGFIA